MENAVRQELEIKDCALIVMAVNIPPVFDLRDLRERLEVCPLDSLYHHFCQTLLRPTFDDPEYHNDFAFWARHNLFDKTFAERLAILNPYDYENLEDLRLATLDIVEDRIGELPHISNVQTGSEFRFLQALTVRFETGVSVESPLDVRERLETMTHSSIWYHFIDARRRNPDRTDDFTRWFTEQGFGELPVIEAFSKIDFYFMSLREIQEELIRVCVSHLA
jgi:hypothetical protein